MKIGFFGDVVGKSGRRAVADHLPMLKRDEGLDFVVINAENAAHGFGITEKTANELFAAGADCLTLGNHAWDQREALSYIEREERLLRPYNYPPEVGAPGKGAGLYTLADGRRVYVISLMGIVFMEPLNDPFQGLEEALAAAPLGMVADTVIVDLHAEATSEKVAMGHVADGRASLLIGTHTHVPTADGHILSGGTAYQSDAGMTGDYGGVLGMDKEAPIHKFTTRLPGGRKTPAEGEGTLCGVIVETDDATGLAKAIKQIKIGGVLGA